MTDQKLGALMVDFDNIYVALMNQYGYEKTVAESKAIKIIGSGISHLESSQNVSPIIRKAIADWSMYPSVPNELYTMGVKVDHIKGMEGKNSADIEISLNLFETMLTRPEIDVFVVVAGDRDYLPIAQRALARAKQIVFYSFDRCLSGDIKKLVGEDNYYYIDPEDAVILEGDITEKETVEEVTSEEEGETAFSLSKTQRRALLAAIEAEDEYGPKYGSVRLSGFLVDRLAKALPEKGHLDRKEIFNRLIENKLVNLETGEGLFGETFLVFTIDRDHPIVKEELSKLEADEEDEE